MDDIIKFFDSQPGRDLIYRCGMQAVEQIARETGCSPDEVVSRLCDTYGA